MGRRCIRIARIGIIPRRCPPVKGVGENYPLPHAFFLVPLDLALLTRLLWIFPRLRCYAVKQNNAHYAIQDVGRRKILLHPMPQGGPLTLIKCARRKAEEN